MTIHPGSEERPPFQTISKVGCRRHRQKNGLLEMISRYELFNQIKALGLHLNDEYRGKPVTFLPILHGARRFHDRVTDFFEMPDVIECAVVAKSYEGQRQGKIDVYSSWIIPEYLAERHLLVFDDIIDSGRTAEAVVQRLYEICPRPLGVTTCFMLRKNKPRNPQIKPDYVAFDIDDCWVAGFGLDGGFGHNSRIGSLRNLHYIAEVPPGWKGLETE